MIISAYAVKKFLALYGILMIINMKVADLPISPYSQFKIYGLVRITCCPILRLDFSLSYPKMSSVAMEYKFFLTGAILLCYINTVL